MVRRRESFVLGLAVLVAFSTTLLAQKKDDKKVDDAKNREIQSVVKLADDAAAGQAQPNDFALAWAHEDYMKAASNKEYVPFTITLDPSKLSGPTDSVPPARRSERLRLGQTRR